MLSILIVILSSILGAFFYRCRGGFLALGNTQAARILFWALPVALAALSIDNLPTALLCGVGAFLGLLIPHGQWMGAKTGDDVRALSLIGAARSALIAAPLAVHDHAFALYPLAGALMGPIYRHAWRYLDGIDSGISFRGQVFAKGGTEWGEVLTGAAFGLGFAVLGYV